MSVINQVLNQLEQRGAHTEPEQTMVRAVPHEKRRWFVLPLLALLLALAGGLAAWQWIQMRKPALSPVEGSAAKEVLQAQPVVAAAPASASAVQAVAAVQLAVAPASAVAAVAADVAGASAVSASEAGSGIAPVELPQPASRLSFELNSIPLPSSLRQTAALPDALGAAPEGGEKQAPVRSAKPQPAAPPPARLAAPGAPPIKQVSPAQHADAEFRKATASMQQGHVDDAMAGYETVLRIDAGHDTARQALVALLLENRRSADAARVLQERLKTRPEHTGFAMLLARLQVEHGTVEQALATLEKSLPYADAQADYQAFFAALLQRQNRHKEAIAHYQIALQLAPDNGVWLMGYGISLQAVQRNEDAANAFRRALGSGTLNPELQAFVRQKIKEL